MRFLSNKKLTTFITLLLVLVTASQGYHTYAQDEKPKGPIPEIEIDPLKIRQVIFTVIDNAIKYTERGEVSVLLKQSDKEVVIKVKDTGIGIPKEHIDRIFERFYVVDKSRSKKLGGTGLGLSIVKHIVLLHNGKIDVKSTPDEGTEFTITFPADLS